MIRYALFDLDQTLYPSGTGIMKHMDRQIERYMIESLGFTPEATRELRPKFWRQYGTTLSGLLHEFGVDPTAYLKYIHDVPLEKYIRPNPELGRALQRLSMEKVIFTNSTEDHCVGVLRILGIESHFSRIFDLVDNFYVSKPNLGPYRRTLQTLGCQASECLMVEDSAPNLLAAATLGMTTVLVGSEDASREDFDFTLERIEESGGLATTLDGSR